MTKTKRQELIARAAEIVLHPHLEFRMLKNRLKVKLRLYKKEIENGRTFVAPFGWEYKEAIGGYKYLWPINHKKPE